MPWNELVAACAVIAAVASLHEGHRASHAPERRRRWNGPVLHYVLALNWTIVALGFGISAL